MLVRCCTGVLLVVLAACGNTSSPDAGEPAASSSPPTDVPDDPTESETGSKTDKPTPSTKPDRARSARIVAGNSEFGRMLFDRTGQAIYLFDVETTSSPKCYGACAEDWPPVLTKGDPVAGPGVAGALLGTTERRDGTVQVTYDDHPLYFYAHEGKREVKCHNVFLNGGNWYVVQPGGGPAPPG